MRLRLRHGIKIPFPGLPGLSLCPAPVSITHYPPNEHRASSSTPQPERAMLRPPVRFDKKPHSSAQRCGNKAQETVQLQPLLSPCASLPSGPISDTAHTASADPENPWSFPYPGILAATDSSPSSHSRKTREPRSAIPPKLSTRHTSPACLSASAHVFSMILLPVSSPSRHSCASADHTSVPPPKIKTRGRRTKRPVPRAHACP